MFFPPVPMATTIDGIRYSGLSVEPNPSGALLSGGTVRLADPAQPAAYVDVSLSNWQIADGRPTSGSATVSGKDTTRCIVNVQQTNANGVVYTVTIERDGTPVASYTVVATYTNGTPSYAIAPI